MGHKNVYQNRMLISGRNLVHKRVEENLNPEFTMNYWKESTLRIDLFTESKEAKSSYRFIQKCGENRLYDALATLNLKVKRLEGANSCSGQVAAENYKPRKKMTPQIHTPIVRIAAESNRHIALTKPKQGLIFWQNGSTRMYCCWCC